MSDGTAVVSILSVVVVIQEKLWGLSLVAFPSEFSLRSQSGAIKCDTFAGGSSQKRLRITIDRKCGGYSQQP
jgi:hypothetical protein